MSFNNGPTIVTNGLVLALDAGDRNSYVSGSNTWFDLTGVNNGTLTNGPTFDSGSGGSIVFDGVDDNVILGDVLNLGTNDLTINAWIKLASGPNNDMYIFSKSKAASQNYRYGFTIYTGKVGTFFQGNTPGLDVGPLGSTTLTPNVWYMVTTVLTRSSVINMYVNGVQETLVGSNTISQWNGLDFQSTNPARVGSYTQSDNLSPLLFFKGLINITQVYFRALSAQEVLQNYNATKGRFGL
jgi:hypothetical protein